MTPGLDPTRRLAAIVLGRAGMDLYPMPDGTLGRRAMLYLHSRRVRIVGDGFEIEHARLPGSSSSEFSE